jgi:hypothetical protein
MTKDETKSSSGGLPLDYGGAFVDAVMRFRDEWNSRRDRGNERLTAWLLSGGRTSARSGLCLCIGPPRLQGLHIHTPIVFRSEG